MTLDELKSLVHHATKNDAIRGVFPRLVNHALKDIQRRRSWRCMKATIAITIPAGQSYVVLPANFKEPQRGKTPLKTTDSSPEGISIWTLLSKQEVERLRLIGLNTSERKAYLDFYNDSTILAIVGPATIDLAFLLDSYIFLPELSNSSVVQEPLATDTDAEVVATANSTPITISVAGQTVTSNYFTREYPQMVLEKTKALAFALEADDPESARRADVCEQRFLDEFQRASVDDAAREVAGRSYRMGGF